MAEFNNTIGPPTQIPDQTRASQGYRDDALGGLFNNISESFQIGLKATDDFLKRRVGDEARQMVEPLRDDMIANLAAYQGGDPTAGLPPEAGQEFERLAKYKTGVKVGRLSDSYYRSQLDVVSKKLRRSYPGYEDEIDNRLQELTGSVPANKLLADLQAEASAINSSKASNKALTYWQEHVDNGDIDPRTQPFESFNGDVQAIAVAAAPKIQTRTTLALNSQIYANAKSGDEVDKITANRAAEVDSNLLLRDALSDITTGLGKKKDELIRNIASLDPKVRWDEKDIQALEVGAKQFEAAIRTKLSAHYNTPDDNGVTRASILGQDSVNKIIEARVQDATNFMSDIRDKNTGKIIHNESLNVVHKEGDQARLLEDQALRRAATINTLFGNPFGNIWMSENPEIMGRPGLIVNNVTGGVLTGEYSSVDEAVKKSTDPKATAKEREIAGKEIFTKFHQLMTDPTTPADAKSRLIRAAYGDNNVGFITNSPQNFSKWTDMKTLQEVYKFSKESGQPELWNKTYEWTLKTGTILLRNQSMALKNMVTSDRYGTVSYNPKTNQFDYVPTGNQAPIEGQGALARFADGVAGQYITSPIARNAVTNTNITINNMRKVFEVADPATAESNTNTWVSNLVSNLGPNFNRPKDPQTGLQGMFYAYKEAMDSILPKPEVPLFQIDDAGRIQLNITTGPNGELIRRPTPNSNTIEEQRLRGSQGTNAAPGGEANDQLQGNNNMVDTGRGFASSVPDLSPENLTQVADTLTGIPSFMEAINSGDPKEIAKQAAIAIGTLLPFPGGRVAAKLGGKVIEGTGAKVTSLEGARVAKELDTAAKAPKMSKVSLTPDDLANGENLSTKLDALAGKVPDKQAANLKAAGFDLAARRQSTLEAVQDITPQRLQTLKQRLLATDGGNTKASIDEITQIDSFSYMKKLYEQDIQYWAKELSTNPGQFAQGYSKMGIKFLEDKEKQLMELANVIEKLESKLGPKAVK